MKPETENALKSILQMDGEVHRDRIVLAIAVLKGENRDKELLPILKRKEAAHTLGVHVRTIDYYARVGILDKVYGAGTRIIGVTRESVINRLNACRVVHERSYRR